MEASPFIELGTSKNLVSIEWDADTPPGTDVIIQTKTGATAETEVHYFDKGGLIEFEKGDQKKARKKYETKVSPHSPY